MLCNAPETLFSIHVEQGQKERDHEERSRDQLLQHRDLFVILSRLFLILVLVQDLIKVGKLQCRVLFSVSAPGSRGVRTCLGMHACEFFDSFDVPVSGVESKFVV